LRIGAVFTIFGGLTFWFQLFIGLSLPPLLSKAHFFIIFLGVNVTFFPQHFLGLQGMPRRYSDYPDNFQKWNTLSSFGSLISIMGAFFLLSILWYACVTSSKTVTADSFSLELGPRAPLSFHSFSELVRYY